MKYLRRQLMRYVCRDVQRHIISTKHKRRAHHFVISSTAYHDAEKESTTSLAVISVCKSEHCPLWMNVLGPENSMDEFLDESIINLRSQDLPQYYRLNGAIYIVDVNELIAQEALFLKSGVTAYIMPNDSSVDIDEENDFSLAEFLISKRIEK